MMLRAALAIACVASTPVFANELRDAEPDSAKTIPCAGRKLENSAYAKPSGWLLEMVPESNPCKLRKDDGLTVRVLFEGKPLAGAQVSAFRKGEVEPPPMVSDRNGRATLRFPEAGAWYVRVSHGMRSASGDQPLHSTLAFNVGPRLEVAASNTALENAEFEVRRLLDEQDAAWNRADIDTAMGYYWKSGGLTYAGPDGVTRGWQGLLERYERIYPDTKAKGQVTYSDLEVSLLAPDAALVLSRWRLDRDAGDPLTGVFTFVLRKFPEGWRVVHDHSSTDE